MAVEVVSRASAIPARESQYGAGGKASLDKSGLNKPQKIRASSVRPARVVPEDTAFRRDAFREVVATTGAEVSRLPKGEKMPDMEEYVKFSEGNKDEHRAFVESFASSILSKVDSSTPGGKEKLKAMPYAEQALQILGVADKKLGTPEYDAAIKSGVDKLLSTPDGWMYVETLMEQETDLMESAAGFAIASLPAAERDIVGKSLEGIWRQIYTGEKEGVVHNLGSRAMRTIHDNLRQIEKVLGTGGAGSIAGLITATSTPTGVGAFAGLLTSLGIVAEESARKQGETITRSPSADRLESIRRNPQLVEYMKLRGIFISDFDLDQNGQIIAVRQDSTMPIGEMLNGAMSNRMTRRHFMTELGIPISLQNISDVQGYLSGETERTGERRAKMVKDRFEALGGRAELANNAVQNIDQFMDMEAWREKHQVPSEAKLGIPHFDPNRLRPQEDAEDRNGNRRGRSDLEDAFWGRGAEGANIAARLNHDPNTPTYNEKNLIAQGRIRVLPNSPDEWGQRPGDAGYGVEKREARRIIGRMGRERTERVRTTGNNIQDRWENSSESVGFARTDGREIKLPDRPYPDAILKHFDVDSRRLLDYEVTVRVDGEGNIQQVRNREDIWGQHEFIDLNRVRFEDRIRNEVGLDPTDSSVRLSIDNLLDHTDTQRQFALLGIGEDEIPTLTRERLQEALDNANKTHQDVDIDRLVTYSLVRRQLTELDIDDRFLLNLNAGNLRHVIENFNSALPDGEDPHDFDVDDILRFAQAEQLIDRLDNGGNGISRDEILQVVPDYHRNRFFAILDVQHLKDVDGNPIDVDIENIIVNNDPPDAEDGPGQHPDALFYNIFDGRLVALPAPDDNNRRRIYRPVRNRWGRTVDYTVEYDDNQDVWGQKRARRGRQTPDSRYVFSFNAGLLGPYIPNQNVDAQYLLDPQQRTEPQRGYFVPNPELTNINPNTLRYAQSRGIVATERELAVLLGQGITENEINNFADTQELNDRATAAGINTNGMDLDEVRALVDNRFSMRMLEQSGFSEQTLLTFDVGALRNAIATAGFPIPDIVEAQQFIDFLHVQADLAAIRRTGISDNDIMTLSPAALQARVQERLQQRNPYFARRENAETGAFTPDNFDKKYWIDEWNQPYYLPNGERNWFFGRANRTELLQEYNRNLGLIGDQALPTGLGALEDRPINLDLFRNEDLQDTLNARNIILQPRGRELPNEDTGRGKDRHPGRKIRGGTRLATGERLDASRDYFEIEVESPARDARGRYEDDTRFGLTDAQITQALVDYRNDPDTTFEQQQAVDRLLAGTALYEEPTIQPNYELFDRRTGLDIFGQWPWDPNFCQLPGRALINVDRTEAGFQGPAAIDRRGRKFGDNGFGTGAGAESATIDTPETLDRLRRARVQVIMFYGERLISSEYTNPNEGELAALKRRIDARRKGGRLFEEGREERPNLERDGAFVESQLRPLTALREAQEARETAAAELTTFLTERFGAGTSVQDALQELQSVINGTGSAQINGINEGQPVESYQRLLNAENQRHEQRIRDVNAENVKEASRKELMALAKEEHVQALQAIHELRQQLQSVSRQITELQVRATLSPAILHNADTVFTRREADLDYFGTLGINAADLRNLPLEELFDRINNHANGWPEARNRDETNRNRVINAQLAARERQLNPGLGDIALANPAYQRMMTAGITDRQLLSMDENDLLPIVARHPLFSGATYDDTLRRDLIQQAQLEAQARLNARLQATEQLQQDIRYQVSMIDREEPSDEMQRDLDQLLPMQDILSNMTAIMKKRDDLISNPSKYFPVKTEITAEGVTQYDELQMWSDVGGRDRVGYSEPERDFMNDNPDVPVAYLGMLHFLTDYQNPNALVYLDPDRNETRATYFKKLTELLPPTKLVLLMRNDEDRLDQPVAFNGSTIAEVMLNLQKSLRLVGNQDAERFAWNRADQARIEGGNVVQTGGVIPIGDRDIRLLVEDISDNLAKEVLAAIN